ncbi:alpha/beta hydrolase [Dactylosporangium sp. AC04546]|uniref:alpha/beta fold hydrolase n=1 Tax=Dactylosporangium sp. AC04546 TaxID=2862460 RepID=UPI001EDDFE43|nr:alpha/beta hydrolase [Dactylosporangium sp. AC04546]WVK88300.1 alpha/beta hydrolase [Dactylosporangium sp. AC04546]
MFLHGTPGSRLSRPDDDALGGVRLITLDRPGYGLSTPVRRPSLLGVAGDVAALTGSLGIERFGVAGFSGGAPYALACGARFPQRLTGVIVAGGTGPARELGTLTRWEWLQVRDVRCRVLLWAGRDDPGRAVPDAALMAERLPDAEVTIAGDAAHTPSPEHWRAMLGRFE